MAKVGAAACTKGLHSTIKCFSHGSDWQDRPDTGYVIGATPYATCSSRLEDFEFDTVIFDEASQITVPLAVMAMRKAKRYVFVGDHKQLPPVVLSKSILDKNVFSIFAKLIANHHKSATMLNKTYRMNQELCRWPGHQYYGGKLAAVGANAQRQFGLPHPAKAYQAVLSSEHSLVFIKSPGINAKTANPTEAALVVEIIASAYEAGMALEDIGLVCPFRNHSKLIRKLITARFGMHLAKTALVDTVERMQGQERELVILSLCTTDPQLLAVLAPFLFQSERLNVAITRAKTKLIVVGPKLPANYLIDKRDTDVYRKVHAYRSLINSAHEFLLNKN